LVSQFQIPFNIIVLSLIALSASTGTALAQESSDLPNQSAAALRSAQSIDTPNKKANWLRQKFHMVLSQQWPVNFPVPVYNSNVIQKTFSNSTQGQPRAAASLVTTDSPERVFDFYQSALSRAKWTVRLPSPKARSDMHLGSDFYFLKATQGRQSIDLTCMANPKSHVTFLSVTWEKKL
jgi:hypothetical protein